MKNFIYLFAPLAMLMFVACEKDIDNPHPMPPIEQSDFSVEVTALDRSSVSFVVTPKDDTMPYFVALYDKDFVEDFSKEEYLVGTIYQDIEETAGHQGLTFDEYMAQNVLYGVSEHSFDGLAFSSDYTILVFGVDTENGYMLNTELCKTTITTLGAPQIDCTFEVTATVDKTSVKFVVTPSDEEALWHLLTVPQAMYESYTDPNGYYAMSDEEFYTLYLNSEIEQYASAGYSEEQIMNAIFLKGSLTLSAKGLMSNTEYLYLVAGIVMEDDGIYIATPIHIGNYTSSCADPSDMTFNISVWDIDTLSASVRIEPSKSDENYFHIVQSWDGKSSAEEVMNQLVMQYGGWLETFAASGVVEYSGEEKMVLEAAGTQYYVIAFGYNGGVTTAPEMYTFSTLPGGDPNDAEFTMTASNVTSYGMSVTIDSSDKTIFYSFGILLHDQFNEAELLESTTADIERLYEETRKLNPMVTLTQILSQYFYKGKQEFGVSGLAAGTDYMGYVVVIDQTTGEAVKVITFDDLASTVALGEVTPSLRLLGIWSGDEEAGSIFNDPFATKGQAIAVVEYYDFEGATKLFISSILGDYALSSAYADSALMPLLSWSRIDMTKPYTFAVLDWMETYTFAAYAEDATGAVGTMGRLSVTALAEDKLPMDELHALVDEIYGSSTRVLPASVVVAEPSAVSGDENITITPITAGCDTMQSLKSADIMPVKELQRGNILVLNAL